MNLLLLSLGACLIASLCSAREVLHVTIGYSEGRAKPQGDYLLVPGKEARYSLRPITGEPEPPAAKLEEIIPSLEKAYPALKGKVEISPLEDRANAMTAAGQVKILGQVKNPGNHTAGNLGTCVSGAVPTEFGSIRRIQVAQRGEIRFYNLDKPDHFQIKLEPGAIVLIPTKMVIGH